MDYSRNIKAYRERNFLTQTDLAKLLGVSFTTVNRRENGKFEPTMKMKKKLNDLFKKEKGIQ
jgi:DNA-binding XRE family transcriptional regulator